MYNLIRTLGKGAYAEVCLAQHTDTGYLCALKVMERNSTYESSMVRAFMTEMSALRQLTHPNIVRYLDSSDEATLIRDDGEHYEVYYIALELAETGAFSEKVARYFFHQLCDAFEYMH